MPPCEPMVAPNRPSANYFFYQGQVFGWTRDLGRDDGDSVLHAFDP